MGFFTTDGVANSEQWALEPKVVRNSPVLRVEEPDISWNMKGFLRVTLDAQWEAALVHQSGDVLLEQMMAYLAGYKEMTSFNGRQSLRLLPAWTATERRGQLELLDESGSFSVI